MDPIRNPFAPGAGAPPPELAGREALLRDAEIAIARTRRNLQAKSLLLVGLRGVGKTVLLDRIRQAAEATGVQTVRLEAPEGRSLPGVLAPPVRQALLRLSRSDRAKDLARRGLAALAGFAGVMKVKFGDVEVGIDVPPERGLADNGDLQQDLTALLETLGDAARGADTAVALFIDELQYVREEELAALITALHRCVQRQLPIVLLGAGLPQLRARTGEAKSYAERMFSFPEVGPLDEDAARKAIERPLAAEGVRIETPALDHIFAETRGYPYFLQEWGKHVWDVAPDSPVTEADVTSAAREVIAALDASFFRVRFDRLTSAEKRYLRAMAELGQGPHRSGEVADVLGKQVSALGPARAKLIEKGMIWSPQHGDTAFTVPLFDEFMRRIMPGEGWRES